MSDDVTALPSESPKEILRPLFIKAQCTDEFEFCCTLLRIRGIEDAHWDPLSESYQLAQQLISLIDAPLDKSLSIRLMLFLYCHLTEMDDLYNIVANLLLVTEGERYSMIPFRSLPNASAKLSPGYCGNPRIDQFKVLADRANFHEVGRVFETMFVRPVRNAFYHSDYILSPESFNIRKGEGVDVGNIVQSKVEYDWLIPRLELGVNTAFAVMELLLEFSRSYRKDRIIQGRFAGDGSWMDIQLTTDADHGLTGFRTPPDFASEAKPLDEKTKPNNGEIP